MRWVETRSYIGPDRRREKRLRFFDRRNRDDSVALPAVQVLLRQLHLRVLDVQTAREALSEFELRVSVTANALRNEGQGEAVTHLKVIETKVAASLEQGALAPKDAELVQAQAAAAICALR